MEELKQNEQIQTPKTKKTDEFHLKQITIIALAIFITFCCCILFFFVIYRYNGFTDFWKKLTYILQPVIIGLVVAYLLNPLMKLIDGKLFSLFKGKMKSEKKAKKISRGLAIAGALLFLVGIIVLLIAAIVPSITFDKQEKKNNQSKYKKILLNDSYGFHTHAHHMYVLPHGCAHGENTSHLDYNQVFH